MMVIFGRGRGTGRWGERKVDMIGGVGSLQSKEMFLSLCNYGKRFYRD